MLIGVDASRAFSSPRTGTENYSYQLIKAITQIDEQNEYKLYTRGQNKDEIEKALNVVLPDNFEVININFPRLWTQIGLAKEGTFRPPEILFIPAHTLPVLRSPKIKTVVTIHDLGYEYLPQYHQFPQKLYLNRSTEYAVWQSTKLIAVSEYTKKDLIQKLQATEDKISVIYEGYDKSKFKNQNSQASSRTGLAKIKNNRVLKKYSLKNPFLLFVGTLQPRKNIIRLIESFSLICPKINPKIELVIAGNKGWMYEEILEAPKKFGIEKRVRFLGYTSEEDLPALYSSTLCFCLPSLFEGFGLPVLEAMACGAPVLVSTTSSLPEVAGEAGIYVDAYDSLDVADKLKSVVSSKNMRVIKSKQSIEQAKKFSWEKCAKETIEVFKSL